MIALAYDNEPRVVLGKAELQDEFIDLLAQIPERDPATFFAFTPDQIRLIFSKPETLCALIYGDGEPVAGGIRWRPMPEDPEEITCEHEGGDIGLVAGTYLQLDNTVVIPARRGAGLQGTVIRALTDDVNELVVATVSPDNPASEKTLLKCGFEIRKLVSRHGDNKRYIVTLER